MVMKRDVPATSWSVLVCTGMYQLIPAYKSIYQYDLLDLLQKNLPEKTGEKAAWNLEKAHSILHKVREIVL